MKSFPYWVDAKGDLNYGKWAVNYQQIGILIYKDYDLFPLYNKVGIM